MGPKYSWDELIKNITGQEAREQRHQELLNAINPEPDPSRCQACGKPQNSEHETFEYVDMYGQVLRRCRTLPHPDPVTEEELAYVRRSILGKETT